MSCWSIAPVLAVLALLCGPAPSIDRLAMLGKAAAAPTSLYDDATLAKSRLVYGEGLRGNFSDLCDRVRDPTLRARALATHLELPLRGRHQLDFYASSRQRTVSLPIESVKFLDDLGTALAYRDARECDPSAVFDYAGMLSVSERIVTLPRPHEALSVPSDVLAKDQIVYETSGKLLKSALYFIMAHELGHVVLGHPGDDPGEPELSQQHEIEADAFAIDAMAQIGVVPVGMVVYLRAATYREAPPSSLDQSAYEDYMKAFSTHPITTARLRAITAAVRARREAFAVLSPPAVIDRVVSDIEGVTRLLGQVEMRRFQRIRSERRPLESLRGCTEWAPPP